MEVVDLTLTDSDNSDGQANQPVRRTPRKSVSRARNSISPPEPRISNRPRSGSQRGAVPSVAGEDIYVPIGQRRSRSKPPPHVQTSAEPYMYCRSPYGDDEDGSLLGRRTRKGKVEEDPPWDCLADAAASQLENAPKPRKQKRTREEIALQAEARKQQRLEKALGSSCVDRKVCRYRNLLIGCLYLYHFSCRAAEAAAKKAARQYDSARHVLRYVTLLLDPTLMSTPLGLKIAEAFQQTWDTAEHEQLRYRVGSTGLGSLPAAKWLRQVPATESNNSQAFLESQQSLDLGGSQDLTRLPGMELVEREEPHVLVCFEAGEFVNQVIKDGLDGVFQTLAEGCPGHRPHILVNRLEHYLTKREREDFSKSMKVQSCVAGGGSAADRRGRRAAPAQCIPPAEQFNRGPIDTFIMKLAVQAPHIAFRDLSSPEEGAGHVCAITRAIARRFADKSDAAMYLSGKMGNKKTGLAIASVLATHPTGDESTKTLMAALCSLPSVGPQVAHAVATRYGSLGVLMQMILDRRGTDADKIREIGNLQRPATGPGGPRRVGPKAATQLFELLSGDDPDALVDGDDAD